MTDALVVLDVDGVQEMLAGRGMAGFVATDEAERARARRRVYRLASLGRLPAFSAAGRLRFIASDVEAAMRRGVL